MSDQKLAFSTKRFLLREYAIVEWLKDLTGLDVSRDGGLVSSLGNGITLCHAMLAIKPRSIPKVTESTRMKFLLRQNVVFFVEAFNELRIPMYAGKSALRVEDIYGAENPLRLMECVESLARYAEDALDCRVHLWAIPELIRRANEKGEPIQFRKSEWNRAQSTVRSLVTNKRRSVEKLKGVGRVSQHTATLQPGSSGPRRRGQTTGGAKSPRGRVASVVDAAIGQQEMRMRKRQSAEPPNASNPEIPLRASSSSPIDAPEDGVRKRRATAPSNRSTPPAAAPAKSPPGRGKAEKEKKRRGGGGGGGTNNAPKLTITPSDAGREDEMVGRGNGGGDDDVDASAAAATEQHGHSAETCASSSSSPPPSPSSSPTTSSDHGSPAQPLPLATAASKKRGKARTARTRIPTVYGGVVAPSEDPAMCDGGGDGEEELEPVISAPKKVPAKKKKRKKKKTKKKPRTASQVRHQRSTLKKAGTLNRTANLPNTSEILSSRVESRLAGLDEADASRFERGITLAQARWRGRLARTRFQKRLRDAAYRERVANEILSTETDFVRSLVVLFDSYMSPMNDERKAKELGIDRDKMRACYNDIQVIRNYNTKLLKDLEDRVSDWAPSSCLGDIFLQISFFLKTYSQYVKDYSSFQLELASWKQGSVKFRHFLDEVAQSADGQTIQSLLVMPVQRIPRYNLLLKELHKHTDRAHQDYANIAKAYASVQAVAEYVDQKSIEAENVAAVLDIQTRFVGKFESIMAPHRKFVREAEVVAAFGDKKRRKGQKHTIFLFNDAIVEARPLKKEKLKKKEKRDNPVQFKRLLRFSELTPLRTTDEGHHGFALYHNWQMDPAGNGGGGGGGGGKHPTSVSRTRSVTDVVAPKKDTESDVAMGSPPRPSRPKGKGKGRSKATPKYASLRRSKGTASSSSSTATTPSTMPIVRFYFDDVDEMDRWWEDVLRLHQQVAERTEEKRAATSGTTPRGGRGPLSSSGGGGSAILPSPSQREREKAKAAYAEALQNASSSSKKPTTPEPEKKTGDGPKSKPGDVPLMGSRSTNAIASGPKWSSKEEILSKLNAANQSSAEDTPSIPTRDFPRGKPSSSSTPGKGDAEEEDEEETPTIPQRDYKASASAASEPAGSNDDQQHHARPKGRKGRKKKRQQGKRASTLRKKPKKRADVSGSMIAVGAAHMHSDKGDTLDRPKSSRDLREKGDIVADVRSKQGRNEKGEKKKEVDEKKQEEEKVEEKKEEEEKVEEKKQEEEKVEEKKEEEEKVEEKKEEEEKMEEKKEEEEKMDEKKEEKEVVDEKKQEEEEVTPVTNGSSSGAEGSRTSSKKRRKKRKIIDCSDWPVLFQAEVIFSYNPPKRREDELDVREGEVILVVEERKDGWWRGRRPTTCAEGELQFGLFPGNYAERMENKHSVDSPPSSSQEASPPPLPKSAKPKKGSIRKKSTKNTIKKEGTNKT